MRPPSPVHRLDRDTSGCLLLSRNPKAHTRFCALFERGSVAKTYWAVVEGAPDGEGGSVDLPLGKISSKVEGWRMVHDPKGKPAQTRWRVLERRDGRALIEFIPLTGRTHQNRVHAASGLGTPIAGDPVYGAGRGPMLLHARRLIVTRGEGRSVIDVTAPLPASFQNAGFAAGVDDAG